MVTPLRTREHQEALVKLWKDNLQDPAEPYSHERFAWLYQESPADSARTWLAVETTSNTVIGCGSVVRSNKHIGEHVISTGLAAVLVVEKRHRTAGAALAIQRAITQGSRHGGFDCLIGEPNEQALPIFCRVGYRPVGNVLEWVKPIDAGVELPGPTESCYTDEILDAADERFDRLWNEGKGQYRIVSEKVAAFLNWRYSTFKEARYRHYCLLRREDRQLVGYVVFCVWRKCSIIADMFCADLSGRILETLLLGFASRMRMQGQQWISLRYFGGSWFEDALKRLGFAHGTHQRKLVAYVDGSFSPELRDVMFEQNNWFILGGEMDLF
jgi:hypothetical protein